MTILRSNDPAFASGVKPLASIDLGAGGDASPSTYEFGLCTEEGDSVVR